MDTPEGQYMSRFWVEIPIGLLKNKQQSNIVNINSTMNKSGIYLSQLLKNEMTTQHISDIGACILEYVCGVLK